MILLSSAHFQLSLLYRDLSTKLLHRLKHLVPSVFTGSFLMHILKPAVSKANVGCKCLTHTHTCANSPNHTDTHFLWAHTLAGLFCRALAAGHLVSVYPSVEAQRSGPGMQTTHTCACISQHVRHSVHTATQTNHLLLGCVLHDDGLTTAGLAGELQQRHDQNTPLQRSHISVSCWIQCCIHTAVQ